MPEPLLMDPVQLEEEDAHAHLTRLLRENAEIDVLTVASSRKAIAESRQLLERVARDHPHID